MLTTTGTAPLPKQLQRDLDAAERAFSKLNAELKAASDELGVAGVALQKVEYDFARTPPKERTGELLDRGNEAGERYRECQGNVARISPKWSAAKARLNQLRSIAHDVRVIGAT